MCVENSSVLILCCTVAQHETLQCLCSGKAIPVSLFDPVSHRKVNHFNKRNGIEACFHSVYVNEISVKGFNPLVAVQGVTRHQNTLSQISYTSAVKLSVHALLQTMQTHLNTLMFSTDGP